MAATATRGRWNPALALTPELDPDYVHGPFPELGGIKIGWAGADGGIGRKKGRRSWTDVLRRDVLCAYCGGRLGRRRMTIDHVEALGAGGRRSAVFNGVGACRTCNNDKQGLPLLLFLLKLQGHSFPAPARRICHALTLAVSAPKRRTLPVALADELRLGDQEAARVARAAAVAFRGRDRREIRDRLDAAPTAGRDFAVNVWRALGAEGVA